MCANLVYQRDTTNLSRQVNIHIRHVNINTNDRVPLLFQQLSRGVPDT
jgi:hypothetical protein